ncbi:hypothetical protein NQ176_g8661 [Zarea fungicola]|uniref:Uncharacterized protein n=1 Tax=Zarea fungicola TaxID=93591 RepID=A0ACC1MT47_9HYPO|nr:hypothetical protein NQ176_g8661 [Lecanicillium fungicola]
MLDAMLLSKAIITAHGQCRDGDAAAFEEALSPLVEDFEKRMTERAVEEGQQTEHLLGIMLGSDDAAMEMKKFFVENGQ